MDYISKLCFPPSIWWLFTSALEKLNEPKHNSSKAVHLAVQDRLSTLQFYSSSGWAPDDLDYNQCLEPLTAEFLGGW